MSQFDWWPSRSLEDVCAEARTRRKAKVDQFGVLLDRLQDSADKRDARLKELGICEEDLYVDPQDFYDPRNS